MNQRAMEKEIWRATAAYLDGMSFEEAVYDAGFSANRMTPTEVERFRNAREFVSTQIWRRSR